MRIYIGASKGISLTSRLIRWRQWRYPYTHIFYVGRKFPDNPADPPVVEAWWNGVVGEFKDDVERAIAFYYLIKNSFGSKMFGGWAYSKKGRFRYNTDFAKLAGIRERLKKVYIENLSFDSLIPKYDSKDALFYCDPPYTVTIKGKYYQCDFGEEDHHKLAEALKGVKGKFILSYDDVPATRELYRGFNIRTTKPVRYSTNNINRSKLIYKTELLITNF